MLLYPSNGSRTYGGSPKTPAEMGVDLAGNEPFQAADDLAFCQSLGEPFAEIGEGRRMAAQTYDDDTIEGRIGLSIAAAVQSMPARLAAGGGDRAGPAQFCKGRLRADVLRVVADEDQHLGHRARRDAKGRLQARCAGVRQGIEGSVMLLD